MLSVVNQIRQGLKSSWTVRVPSFALAAIIYLCAAPAWAQNLLANPGFEGGLRGWSYLEDRAGVVELSATAHDGSTGLLLTAPGVTPGAAAIWQDVRVWGGRRYCVSGWVLALAEGGGLGVALDEPEQRVAEALIYGQPSGWTWWRVCAQVQTGRVRVTIWPSPGLVAGGGWIDSLALAAQ